MVQRTPRPSGLTLVQFFFWFMTGDPPPADECWPWAGRTDSFGYGVMDMKTGPNRRDRPMLAHVVAHRLYNFLDPITPDRPCVLHDCDRGNQGCVQPAHLHAGSLIDNNREMLERDRYLRGGRHHRAVLTESDVLAIRSSDLSQATLARQFSVDPSTISLIKSRKLWSHV